MMTLEHGEMQNDVPLANNESDDVMKTRRGQTRRKKRGNNRALFVLTKSKKVTMRRRVCLISHSFLLLFDQQSMTICSMMSFFLDDYKHRLFSFLSTKQFIRDYSQDRDFQRIVIRQWLIELKLLLEEVDTLDRRMYRYWENY